MQQRQRVTDAARSDRADVRLYDRSLHAHAERGITLRASAFTAAQSCVPASRQTESTQSLLRLQRQYGNQFVQRLVRLFKEGEDGKQTLPGVEAVLLPFYRSSKSGTSSHFPGLFPRLFRPTGRPPGSEPLNRRERSPFPLNGCGMRGASVGRDAAQIAASPGGTIRRRGG